MRALSAAELLDVWEIGRNQPSIGRALSLLAAACPETPRDRLAALSIGHRDAQLMTLRTWTFGPSVAGLANCPACDDRLDFGFDLDEIRGGDASPPPDEIVVRGDGLEARCRLPSSADLLAVSTCDGPSARLALFERCVMTASEGGRARAAGELPPAVIAEVVRAMAEADPLADVELALTCPGCGHAWQAVFDVAAFFWSEIAAWAARTLRDVHILASAYGWREHEILALSPRRRQAYLELIET